MLEKGMEVSAVEYIKAQKMRRELRTALMNAMKDYDALLVPTTIISSSPVYNYYKLQSSAAPLLDLNTVIINGNNTEVYQALSRLTVFDITGLPAMNIPGGFIEEEKSKLPIGVQLVGRF
jgi:aspartyl-tRNA(Asn)/glutamyl-tRNA(Gln) amidotransferase subunit A